VTPVPRGIPSGWYHVAPAASVVPGGLVRLRAFGADWVLWRDAAGVVAMQSAWCPHLGADLGGGKVGPDGLRCPFHGFVFNGEGVCVATGYGQAPPARARLEVRPVIERHGLLFAWWGPGAPDWTPDDLSDDGYAPMRLRQWDLRGHPQETTENSVDLGHFPVVHGYVDVVQHAELEVDGPRLRTHYSFRRPNGVMTVRPDIRVTAWGLGYSRVDTHDQQFDLRYRLFVLPTPVEADRIRLTIGLSMRYPDAGSRWRVVPRWLMHQVVGRVSLAFYAADVEADFGIWSSKVHLTRPALAAGDGPVGRFRAWARQFYPDAAVGEGLAE
jgi:phenylpropionate dioxygenase-like ring-hydroxylating dioxygenase large terminal subunit